MILNCAQIKIQTLYAYTSYITINQRNFKEHIKNKGNKIYINNINLM